MIEEDDSSGSELDSKEKYIYFNEAERKWQQTKKILTNLHL